MKSYRVKIYFHSGKSDLFGYSNDNIDCIVSEDVKNSIVEAIANDDSIMKILGIDMVDGTRYINMRTVLYIDIKEIIEGKYKTLE